MKFKHIIFIGLLAGLFLWNCTERIEVEVDSTFTRLVVEGQVSTDTTAHWVRLTTTSDYFQNDAAPVIETARVSIDDGETVMVLSADPDRPGYYLTPADYYGQPGRTYTLRIENVDIDLDGTPEIYTASSRMNPVNPIDSIALRSQRAFGMEWYEIQVWAWDSPNPDWYAFKSIKNGKLLTDTLYELIVQNDEFFNGNYTHGITSQILDQDKPDEVIEIGDTITFEINGITEGYYKYILEAQSQVFPQTPLFSGPPANISTNLDNDAIGFFVAYSVSRRSVIVSRELLQSASVQ
jgi:hypothetical protein